MSDFSQNALNYQRSQVHTDASSSKQVKKIIRLPRRAKIADFGCGPGHFSLQLANKDSEITFIDQSPKMLDLAIENAKQKNLQVETNCSSCENTSEEASYFDWIVSRLAFHHFNSAGKTLEEAYRLLKPGGYFVLCDLEGPSDPIANEINHAMEILHDATHIKSYTSNQILKKINLAKFDIVFMQSNRCESKRGISLEQWMNITNTSSENKIILENIVNSQPKWVLDELNIYQENNEFFLKIRTFLLILMKKSVHA